MSNEEFVGVGQAAEILGCSEKSVRRLVTLGQLPAWRLTPGGWRKIDVAAVRRLRDELRQREPAVGAEELESASA